MAHWLTVQAPSALLSATRSRSFVEGVQGGVDGVANGAGRGWSDRIAIFPSGVDSGGEVGKAHGYVRVEEGLSAESSGAPETVNAARNRICNVGRARRRPCRRIVRTV